MRKIEEVLRLKWQEQRSAREIARSVGIGRTTVAQYLARAAAEGLSWPLPDGLDAAALERRLFGDAEQKLPGQRVAPDWQAVHRELRGKGVTLALLWQEYRERHPDGWQYSQFCAHYRDWRGRLDIVMRQTHRVGEKLFVDYAGHTAAVIDRTTGEVRQAQVFVAVLGASNYTYAEATWSQRLPDWIGAQVRALAFFGGVPEVIVPDNLRSAVNKAHRYEPDLNPTYQDFATHYGCAVIPARVRKPRDKAKAEGGVLLVERWILARLRHRECFSLAELNGAIAALLADLNARPFKTLDGSRLSHFEGLDRPALRPLPPHPYEYAEWCQVRVPPNLHIAVDGHYYSVPHTLIKRQLDVRLSVGTVEVLHQGQRVASHARSHQRGGYTTVADHLPEAHRQYLDWTPERILAWAGTIGAHTLAFIERLLQARPHPQQAFNACFGVLRLGQAYGEARLEAACARALASGADSYRSIASILDKGLDRRPLPSAAPAATPIAHANVRGAKYYH
jgi:transposase